MKASVLFCFYWFPVVAFGAGADSAPGALIKATRHNQTENALALIDADTVNVDQTTSDGTGALHWAAYNSNEELVEALLKAGADASRANDYGSTPMSEAAENGNTKILEMLLRAGADVESPNREGQTALMTVARTNHVKAAQLLIKHGAEVNAREQWRGQTALMWASAQSQPEMVAVLIEHGAAVNARSRIEQWERKVTAEPRPQNRPLGGFTPLLFAAREGCAACARALVKDGATIDLTDPNRISPLLMATLNGRFDVAAFLIEAGADVNKWDMWGRAPLYAAVDFKTVPRGGRPDRPSMDEVTPLQVIEMLLKAGANPNMQLKLFPPYRSLGADRGGDSMLTVGTTPLIRAAKAGDVESIELLLKHGALPDLKNWPGYTPLMAAAGLGSTTRDTRARYPNEQTNLAAAKLLLEAGAGINAADENGRTALHGAASWGWNDTVRFLVDNGADVKATDTRGHSAVDFAMNKTTWRGQGDGPHPEAAALLETFTPSR